jgi:hypothetical protein
MKNARTLAVAFLLAAALLAVPLLALAQVAVPDPSQPDTFLSALLAAVAGGQWKVVAILATVGVVFLLRQGASRLPGAAGAFFASARGGAVLALLGGIVTVLAGVLIQPGAKLSAAVLLNGFVLGVAAAGGWTLVRRLIWGDEAPAAYPTTPPAA